MLSNSAHAEPPATPHYKDHSRLRIYLDGAGQERPITNAADWGKRRSHILAGMQQAMGPLPDRTKLPAFDLKIESEIKQAGVRRQSISFASGDGDRVTAYLWLPEAPAGARSPAMLALHQTSDLGKGEVAGQGKNANQAYGIELAQRGYVVLAPDYPSFGGSKNYDFSRGGYASGTMKGIFNHMRCVDLLSARDDVDPERIGVIGHSLGGHNSMFVAAFDERLKVIVTSCGWTPFHDYYGGKLTGWTSDRYMPRLKDTYGLDPDRVPFDFYEVVAALAPRPFFSCSPVRDENFDVAGVRKAAKNAGEIYELLQSSRNLQIRYPDCEHDFPVETRREAYEFIDAALSHQPARQVP